MIPISLVIEGFGPYVKRQEIDFSAFIPSGLMLIRGETGAGKTVLLDALTYALYGRSSGGQRGEFAVMRTLGASENVTTRVEYTFDAGGKRCRFTRVIRPRKKRSGKLDFVAEQSACYLNEDGKEVPFFENARQRDLDNKARELTGLTCEQFCQVMILPQGQFEKLLLARSDEKEQVLVSLFHAERWQRIAEIVCERATKERQDIEMNREALRLLMGGFGCVDLPALGEKIIEESEKLKALDQTREAAVATLNNERVELGYARDYEVSLEKALLRERELNEALDTETRAKTALDNAYNLLEKAQAQSEKHEEKERVLIDKLEKIRQKRETLFEKYTARLPELNSSYTRLEQAKSAMKSVGDCEKLLETLCASGEEILIRLEKKRRITANDEEKQRLLNKHYLSNAAAALAAELREDCPCPVCGARTHPALYVSDGKQVSEDDIKKSQAKVKKDHEQLTALERDYAKNIGGQEAAKAELDTASKLYGTFLSFKESDLEAKKAEIEVAKKGDAERAELVKKQSSLEQSLKSVSGKEKEALSAAQRVLETKSHEYERAHAMLIHARTELNTEHECLCRAYALCFSTGSANDIIPKAVAEFPTPTTKLREKSVLQCEEEKTRLDRKCGALSQNCDQMRAALADVKIRTAALNERGLTCDKLTAFGKLLRGDNGVSLRRYVLGVMLSSIVAQANSLLQHVHGGRYRLCRTLEGTGRSRKAGLDLEVFDANAEKKRGVASLSGGEKFLVSLSLALGLSSVVQTQSGGVRMDAMFIDEGFGTLDPRSVADALDVLAQVRGSRRLVGIISHVEALNESISASIEVIKERDGSHVVIHL